MTMSQNQLDELQFTDGAGVLDSSEVPDGLQEWHTEFQQVAGQPDNENALLELTKGLMITLQGLLPEDENLQALTNKVIDSIDNPQPTDDQAPHLFDDDEVE
jgi:hypothetical protein